MVVDDDPNFLMLCEMQVKYFNLPVEVVSYSNPEFALDEIEKVSPDMLFLDINMPQTDGWAFLESIENRQLNTSIYIVTSSIDIYDQKRAMGHDIVNGFISKPLDREKLKKVLSFN